MCILLDIDPTRIYRQRDVDVLGMVLVVELLLECTMDGKSRRFHQIHIWNHFCLHKHNYCSLFSTLPDTVAYQHLHIHLSPEHRLYQLHKYTLEIALHYLRVGKWKDKIKSTMIYMIVGTFWTFCQQKLCI